MKRRDFENFLEHFKSKKIEDVETSLKTMKDMGIEIEEK
jgi:hypothetical protein